MKSQEHRYLNLIVILSFIILAGLNTMELVHFHEILTFQNGDLPFHWQRILELVNSHRIFPYYDMDSFKNSGSAVMTMYPYLWLYPFALIYRAYHSITVTTEWFLGINTLVSLLISYYSSRTFTRSRSVSYLFAVMYTLSFSLFLNTVDSYAIGMNDAFIVMPLVVFGFISWLRHGHWLTLAIGMTALIYSEVLITVFVMGLFIFWSLINVLRLTQRHVVNLVKATILTLMLTALFWLPAIRLYFSNQILSMGANRIQGVNLAQSLGTAFHIRQMVGQNNVFLMTIYVALGLIVGLSVFFYGRRIRKQMYLISVLILLLISSWFPWAAFRRTVLSNLQFPWRFYLVPQVILTYLLAEGVLMGLHYVIYTRKTMCQVLLTLVLMVTGLQLVNQYHYFVTLPNDTRGAVIQMHDQHVLSLNDAEYHDYYPQRADPRFHEIERHAVTLPNGRSVMTADSEGHGRYVISGHRNYQQLVIPFIMYHNTRYQVRYDGRRIKPTRDRNDLLLLKQVRLGQHQIQITIQPSSTSRLAKLLTILGVIIYLWTLTQREIKKRAVNHEN